MNALYPWPELANRQGLEFAGWHLPGSCRAGRAVKSCCSSHVLEEKGVERWKLAQSCCSCSPWPLGSSPGVEAGASSGGFICCVALLGLSSAQPHPNTLLPSSPRGPGVSDCCCLRVLNHLQLGNEVFFFPVASSSQGCAERVASGQSSRLSAQLLVLSVGAILGVIVALAAVVQTHGWRAGD